MFIFAVSFRLLWIYVVFTVLCIKPRRYIVSLHCKQHWCRLIICCCVKRLLNRDAPQGYTAGKHYLSHRGIHTQRASIISHAGRTITVVAWLLYNKSCILAGWDLSNAFQFEIIMDVIFFNIVVFYWAWFLSTIFPFLRPHFVQYVNLYAHLETQRL